MDILTALRNSADPAYGDFVSRLTPGIAREAILGVRVPRLRVLARALRGTPEEDAFLRVLPHDFYDENMLHALLLGQMADFSACLAAVEAFLPFVDNWAVCDGLSPGVFAKHRDALLPRIRVWVASDRVYTCRFGLGMLMRHFLTDAFGPEILSLAAEVWSEEYYVNMMTAWFFATALAKQYDAAVAYLQRRRLAPWVHNKTIQKAVESDRIPDARKAYLKTLRWREK